MRQDVVGIQQQSLSAYNLGHPRSEYRRCARSAASLKSSGWIFLDHAVFHALHVKGYRLYVMLAVLVHDASHSDIGSVPVWRLHNVLMAQTLHVKHSGNFLDRLLVPDLALAEQQKSSTGVQRSDNVERNGTPSLLLRVPKGARAQPPLASHPSVAHRRRNISVC